MDAVDVSAVLRRLDEPGEPSQHEIEAVLQAYETARRNERKDMRISANPLRRQRCLGGYAATKGNEALRTGSERE